MMLLRRRVSIFYVPFRRQAQCVGGGLIFSVGQSHANGKRKSPKTKRYV